MCLRSLLVEKRRDVIIITDPHRPLFMLCVDQANTGIAMKKFIALALLGFALGTGAFATIIIPAAAAFTDCDDLN